MVGVTKLLYWNLPPLFAVLRQGARGSSVGVLQRALDIVFFALFFPVWFQSVSGAVEGDDVTENKILFPEVRVL